MRNNRTYIVAGSKPWNFGVFQDVLCHYPGKWFFVKDKDKLSSTLVEHVNARYIFFLHWSWFVPDKIINDFECVCFHMADVPYGRGGSPLQNLIERGVRETKLTALQMTDEIDAGPVYLKESLSLEGNAEEIYMRATSLSALMIKRIIEEEPKPVAQSGDVIIFNRRRPEQSLIPVRDSLQNLHDFIRMLDANGYPKAFLIHKGFRYEFSRAALYDGKIIADVKIVPTEDNKK